VAEKWRLLVDVGGTNVRFGRSLNGQDACGTRSWPVNAFDSFEAALRAYLTTLDTDTHFSSAAIAAAGPATPHSINLTNNDWLITSADLPRVLGYELSVRLLNDLEAVAYALPYLRDNQVDWIDSAHAPSGQAQRMLAINVGTGFGSASVISSFGSWVSCPAESGHMYLGACDARELALLSTLGHNIPTVEDILSGDGVRRLWAALLGSKTGSISSESPTDYEFNFASPDPTVHETLQFFSTFLARAASNLVLAAATWDGVYLCGSVAIAWSQSADYVAFRRAFVGTGKMCDRLAQTPIGLIRHELPAFVGLTNVDVPSP